MTLIIDNPAVEKILNPAEINDALELAALELSTGGAINAPPIVSLRPRILRTTGNTRGFLKAEGRLHITH